MASQGKAIGIVAWTLVGLLLIGVGTLAFLNHQQSQKAAGLGDALFQVGTTAGVTNLAPELLKQPAALPGILQQVQTAIQGVQQELANTKDALTASQTAVADAKAESATLSQSVKDQKTAVESLTKDLAAKDTALAEAKSLAEQVALETKDAQAEAEKKKAELDGTIESLKAQMVEETAKLQAELDAARQQVQALEAAAAPTAVSVVEGEIPMEAGAGEAVVLTEPEVLAEESVPEPEAEESEGRVIGQSQMFSLIHYTEEAQTLVFRLLDGQTLTYREVPLAVYDRLASAGDKLDMNFRFNIEGSFKSIPPDSVVVRKYWKWQRRHPAKSDVRVIETLVPPAVEAASAPAVEAAPAEASAEEVAPATEALPAEEATPAEIPAAEEVVPAEESTSVPAETPAADVAPAAEPTPAPAAEIVPMVESTPASAVEAVPAAEPAPAGE